MPVAVSYPGVYIEEIPSGVRPITGVATSITAFIGRAARGPANDPVTINSFGDFERAFGGLGAAYPMSYAIGDFYLNGGCVLSKGCKATTYQRNSESDERDHCSLPPLLEHVFNKPARSAFIENGTKPNTTYTVQRAPEIGRALGSDGVCQRALGISPWSPSDPPAPAFVTFNQPGTTTAYTVTSSAAGEATLDFTFSAPSVPTGTRFDVMFRLMDDLAAPTSLFMSGCFTVTVL